jgi:hypothetical protein
VLIYKKLQFRRQKMCWVRDLAALLWLCMGVLAPSLFAQGMSQGSAPPTGLKVAKCKNRSIPQLDDVTAKSGVQFDHVANQQAKYLPESMSGGVLLIDYDRDGWPDIYFTNAPTLEMALKREKARSALYHNNHDGTFSDVTEKAGIATPVGQWEEQLVTTTMTAGPTST